MSPFAEVSNAAPARARRNLVPRDDERVAIYISSSFSASENETHRLSSSIASSNASALAVDEDSSLFALRQRSERRGPASASRAPRCPRSVARPFPWLPHTFSSAVSLSWWRAEVLRELLDVDRTRRGALSAGTACRSAAVLQRRLRRSASRPPSPCAPAAVLEQQGTGGPQAPRGGRPASSGTSRDSALRAEGGQTLKPAPGPRRAPSRQRDGDQLRAPRRRARARPVLQTIASPIASGASYVSGTARRRADPRAARRPA